MLFAVPVYNEEKGLPKLLEHIKPFLEDPNNRMIIVDDGSLDNSDKIIREFIDTLPEGRVFHIRHEKNVGLSGALISAFKLSLENEKDYFPLITIDGDGQLCIDNIMEYVSKFNENRLDFMLVSRDFSKYPFFKRIGNYILSFIAGFLLGKKIHDIESGLRILSKRAVNVVIKRLAGSKYSIASEMVYIVNRYGLNFECSGKNKIIFYRSRTTIIDFFRNLYFGVYQYFRYKDAD